MKDKIFIAWNGNDSVAQKVKNNLKGYDYLCYIGGNDGNNTNNVTIGDTIISQFKECNQAIIIFQNYDRKNGPQISQNVFYELGLAYALYGTEKVHCVKKESEVISLPSDFDNSFVESLPGKDDDSFADNIVKKFLERQKMTLTVNKFDLINDRHIIHDYLKSHYSENGSKCSDYELAQYILFYMLSGQMYQDADRIKEELEVFNSRYHSKVSNELALSLDFSIGLLQMVSSIVNTGDNVIYIPYNAYCEFEDICQFVFSHTEQLLKQTDVGDFYKWINMFLLEGWNYAYLLIAQNPTEISKEERLEFLKSATDVAEQAFTIINALEETEVCKKNHDADGVLALIRSYLCRNQFLVYADPDYLAHLKKSGTDTSEEQYNYVSWLEKAKALRFDMMNRFNGVLDTKIYMHFCIEYHLTILEYLNYQDAEIGLVARRKYKTGVDKFLTKLDNLQQENNVYIEKIKTLYDNLKND